MNRIAMPQVVGHRGVPLLAPENSLKGFRLAAKAGLRFVEFDVRVADDGTLFVFHDDVIGRNVWGEGRIDALPGKEIFSLPLLWPNVSKRPAVASAETDSETAQKPSQEQNIGQEETDQFVPSLEAVAALLAEEGLGAHLELKMPHKVDPKGALERGQAIAAWVAGNWPENVPLVFSSFYTDALKGVCHRLPHVPRALLFWKDVDGRVDRISSVGASAAHVSYRLFVDGDDEFPRMRVQDWDLPLRVYTVNDLALARDLAQQDIDAVISDDAEGMLAAGFRP